MYRAIGEGNKIIWDNKENKLLAKFSRGVFETEDESIANRLRELGYTIEHIEVDGNNENPLENMGLEELKEYALKNNIDIGNSTSLEGILKKIKATL